MKAVNLVTFHEGFLARKSPPPTTLALSIKLWPYKSPCDTVAKQSTTDMQSLTPRRFF